MMDEHVTELSGRRGSSPEGRWRCLCVTAQTFRTGRPALPADCWLLSCCSNDRLTDRSAKARDWSIQAPWRRHHSARTSTPSPIDRIPKRKTGHPEGPDLAEDHRSATWLHRRVRERRRRQRCGVCMEPGGLPNSVNGRVSTATAPDAGRKWLDSSGWVSESIPARTSIPIRWFRQRGNSSTLLCRGTRHAWRGACSS